MKQERVRRLAAVWFADIVGYTSLSATDEDAALAVVEALQQSARDAVDTHGGRIAKFVGDAVLAVFDSADGALQSAMALRQAFAVADIIREYGGELRIGLHLGEVVETEDGDVYGDGVNVASRLQGKARPGQIVVGRAVADLIRARPEYELVQLAPWMRLKGLGFARLFVVVGAGEKPPPPRRIPVNRAVAIGVTAAVLAFTGLIIGVGFRASREEAPAPTEPAVLAVDPAVELGAGVEYYFAGELDKAVERLAPFTRSPLRDLPDAEVALRYLARAHLELHDPERARTTLEQLLNSEPPMALLIPSVESDSLMDLYYEVRTDSRRAPRGLPVRGVIVFDLRFVSDRDDPQLREVGPSVSQMLVSELDAHSVPVRYPWEVMLGLTGEGAYGYFQDRILRSDDRPSHAMFGRVAVRGNQLAVSARIYEMATGGLVVSRTVTGAWPDGLFGLVEQLGDALSADLDRVGAP